ncbi:MAG: O-methyltransferase [Planctomycetes bacterium]|nr:O-methyltransferase [Planctomycetota bacterium]
MTARGERAERESAYIREVFGAQARDLGELMPRAAAAGLPQIAVSAETGRLLSILAGLAGAGGREHLALELGTLGGYSAIWIARGLGPRGRLITVEPEERHAAFAERAFADAGVAKRVVIWRTTGLAAITRIAAEMGQACLDFVFIDAEKTEYCEYFEGLRELIAPGGILTADNVLGSSSWSITDAAGSSAARDAVDSFNRRVVADPLFEASVAPLGHGVLIARRKGGG